MQEVGEIIHLASSGRVIIQLTRALPEGQILCDRQSNKIAKVMELIGPVAKPVASAAPLTNNIKKYEGRRVFATETLARQKQRKRRR